MVDVQAMAQRIMGIVDQVIPGAVVRVTYVAVAVSDSYDATAGLPTVTPTSYTNVPAAPCRLTDEEMEWFPANKETQKILIAYLDLPIVPVASDYVTMDGVRWSVIKVRHWPAKAGFAIFLQKP